MKFTGKLEDLKTIVQSLGINITSEKETEQLSQIRIEGGAIVNLYPTTGTLQFQGKKEAKEKIESLLVAFLKGEPIHDINKRSVQQVTQSNQVQLEDTKVFVVHGHDTAAKEQLELILHRLELNPFVLANTAGGGLTIIESLEKEIGPGKDRARFGIVLLTPDDMGYAKADGVENTQPRARQNVVMEMGMLLSSLGRQNVVILKKGHLEVPSDASGIIYLPFNDHVKETVPKLVERLCASGFNIDPSCISAASS